MEEAMTILPISWQLVPGPDDPFLLLFSSVQPFVFDLLPTMFWQNFQTWHGDWMALRHRYPVSFSYNLCRFYRDFLGSRLLICPFDRFALRIFHRNPEVFSYFVKCVPMIFIQITYNFVVQLTFVFLWGFHIVPSNCRFIFSILLDTEFSAETFTVI